MIIGVTDEKVDLVDAWVAKRKPAYPVVILKDRKLEEALGVQGFPTVGVVDPAGTIAYAGYSPGSVLSKAIDGATKGSIWPAKLAKAVGFVRVGDLPKAHAELAKLGDGLGPEEQKARESLQAHVTATLTGEIARARKLVEEGRVAAAVAAVEPIAKAEPEVPASADAKALLAELAALPTYKLELSGGEAYAEAEALEQEREYLDAVDAYKSVVKKAPGTKIAGLAKARVEDLVRRGLPGYSKNCLKCRQATKACEKHAKPVKL